MCWSDFVQFIWSNLQIRVPSVTALLWDILRENMVHARQDAKARREKEGDEKPKKIPFLGEEIRNFMLAKTRTASK